MIPGRLLLVDDDDDIRTIATISLERVGGWTVVAASSGAAAVAIAQADDAFDAVLLDVMMPDLDGPATLERLRSGLLSPDVPIVFLTAKLQPADQARLNRLGAAGVLAKPFDPMGLPRDLERVLAR
ncbi:MAG: Two-component response regulator [Solirubrobacterales bacterium]|nr:Two-component response regulator [Solirubrobacterales bacterium]